MMDDVPISIRGLMKRDLLENKGELSRIRPEYHDRCRRLRKRTGQTVYTGYLVGEWSVPTPNMEGVAQRYCTHIKVWLDRWLRGQLLKAKRGLRDVERILLTAELRLKRAMADPGKLVQLSL